MGKKTRIDEAARTLFLEYGFEDTSVNAIVAKADVAKGTFYTYYKDKEEIITKTIMREHSSVIETNLKMSRQRCEEAEIPWCQAFIEQTISYFGEHPDLCKLLDHGARARLMMKDIVVDTMCESIPLLNEFYDHLRQKDEEDRDVRNRFLLLSQMLGFTCYQSYVLHKPDDIEHVRPLLMEAAMGLCRGGCTHV